MIMNMQKISFAKLSLAGITLALLFLLSSCSALGGNVDSHMPVIEQLNVDHPSLYPLGNTQVECFAVDQLNHQLKYIWACNAGKITDSGSKVSWETPTVYGDYYIMVTVDDGTSGTVNKIATVSVIVR